MLFPVCSEVVMKLSGFKNNKETNEFIAKFMKNFEPWGDPEDDCSDFIFFDDWNNEIIFRARDETFYDGDEFNDEWITKGLKKLKIKYEEIGEKNDRPLFAEGNKFYYSLKGNVKVVNLDYSNNKVVDKINKKLLDLWQRDKVSKLDE